MLPMSSQRASGKTPINFDDILDPEDLNMELVINWLRHGKNRFKIGMQNQHLVYSLSDPDSRKKMAEIYAPHIVGFEKKPDVSLKAKRETTDEMIKLLNEFPLPTKFPARKNLPVPPPNDALHSTGPLAESALMLFNQIMTNFIKTFVIIKYYSLVTHQDGADEIIHDVIAIVEECAKEPGVDARSAAVKAVERSRCYYEQNKIDSKQMASKYAEDMTSGNFANFPYAVLAVKEILNDVASYKYVRDILKHMYVLMVNEVKIYQKYDEKQEIFKQAQFDKRNTKTDLNPIIITGAIVPSGLAESHTISPIDRPLISLDANSEVVALKGKITENSVIKMPNLNLIPSGARYRLVCDKHKYVLAAENRYAPQLFLKMKYIMDLDIEFGIDFKTSEVTIYRVNKPTKNTGLYLNCFPYDAALIKEYQNKIKFVINNGLNIDVTHLATIIEDQYAQGISEIDFIHGPYEWEKNGETILSNDYNVLVKYKKKKMVNRSKIKEICDGYVRIKYSAPKDIFGKRNDTMPDIDLPDYEHYNYAYECAYDIGDIKQTSVVEARNWFLAKKNTRRVAKWRKYVALNNEYKSFGGEIVDY